tara:strand:+ start:87 stop:416 length:330 start_codon:yes stop_codon:yes gene_type:complete
MTDSSKTMMILETGINHFGKIKEANEYLNYFLKSKFNYLTFMLQSEKFYKKYKRKIDFKLPKSFYEKALSDISIIVKSDTTSHIQESHITILHCICEILDEKNLRKFNI